MPDYKSIISHHESGMSQRMIAKKVHSSRHTISQILTAAQEKNIKYARIADLSDEKIEDLLGISFSSAGRNPLYEIPDFDYCVEELKKPGVTVKLLWEEYTENCLSSGRVPYKLTQFKTLLRDYIDKNEFSDIIHHKPGDSIEVDWAGTRPHWSDPYTGEIIKGYLFVGVLSYSGYGYCEITADMKEETWILCHIHMFEYFQGVARFLIPDNLKTGIIKHPKEGEIIYNKYYEEMADHYGMAILPARVLRPKDKPKAEGMVKQYTREIIARLRNKKFFNIGEYNAEARRQMEIFNNSQFQKKPGSRFSAFQEEKEYLQPLPAHPYEFSHWKKAKVQKNSHISFQKKYYSVPHEYIGYEVELRITDNTLSVYYKRNKLCTHVILKGHDGAYSTNPEHMPKGSNAHQQWDKERFIKWANKIGVNTTTVITNLFADYPHEQQAYNGAKSILLLADKYTPERLEKACEIALNHLRYIRYRDINGILRHSHDLHITEETASKPIDLEQSPYLRGGSYYSPADEEKDGKEHDR